ncbi:MAG: hypothetical protein WD342_21325 [Verrucomicrobiales bacterium]
MKEPKNPKNTRLRFRVRLIVLLSVFGFGNNASYARNIKDQPYFTDPGSWNVKHLFHEEKARRDPSKTRYQIAEFREDGQPWKSEQLSDAVKSIRSFRPRNVILYIHGWNNDASPRSAKEGGDLYDVDKLIHTMQSVGAGKTLAIYVAWRGKSKTGLGHVLTLTDRRDMARQLGKSRSLQDFLGQVASAGKGVGANTVFVGHSLGGVMMENAATDLIVSKRPESQMPHVFLLVNSAALSSVSKKNIDAINEAERVRKQVGGMGLLTPRVVSVTSVADSANEKLNPINGKLFRGQAGHKSIGFDQSILTHKAYRTGSRIPIDPDSGSAGREYFRLSMRPALDPVFWALTPDRRRVQKYRILPRANRSRSPGFWNVQIQETLSSGHNDVYNPRILAASASWLQIANPKLSQLPDTLPELLNRLEEALERSEADDRINAELSHERLQLVNGAALRMPYHDQSIRYLLEELHAPRGIDPGEAKLVFRYRVNLFAILKFTFTPEAEDAWSPENISMLQGLLDEKPMRDALASSGVHSGSGLFETDRNVIAFVRFLRANNISTPRVP